jgi:hypothetical protein
MLSIFKKSTLKLFGFLYTNVANFAESCSISKIYLFLESFLANPMKTNLFSIKKTNFLNLLGMLVFSLPAFVFGQQAANVGNASKAFATITSTDATNTYFSADLTKMPSFFECAYFLDVVFSDPNLVVNNSNISGTSIALFSSKEYDSAKVLESLESYYKKAIAAGKDFSSAQKEELLKKYEKFR